jgi:outer membrane protein assembly factor BamB
MRGRVFIINSDGTGINEGERVMAFDAATGKVLWEYKFNVWHTDIVSSRVGWSNLSGDPTTGRVYAHGVQGLFLCLDGASGALVWQHSLTEEFGRVSGYGGRIVSPLVDENLVIVGMINSSWGDFARGGCRYVAFDKNSGQVVWWSDPCGQIKGTYYSNPIIKVIKGQRLLITGASDGELIALQVRTGVKAWSYPVTANVVNTSPVADGNLICVSHGEENIDEPVQGRVICVDASTIENGRPKLVWEDVGVKAGLASPLLFDGKLVVPDDYGSMHCYDVKTGKKLWRQKYGRVARGSPVWGDGKIYIAEVNARLHIFKPEERRCRELHEIYFPSKSGQGSVETNGTPAVSDERVYFATSDEIYCIGKRSGKTLRDFDAAALPLQAEAAAETQEIAPAHVQVVPADVTLRPGDSESFTVRLFDADGNFIKESAAEWSLPTPPKTPAGLQPPALKGTVADGKLTVASDVPGQQGYLEAKVNNLVGRARIRVAPVLPYAADFEKVPVGATPGGWVNTQGKYQVVEMDGGKVLKKTGENPAPPVARANGYIAMPLVRDYTIQADAAGKQQGANLPDFGVVNCRYTLQMSGNKQELRLLSWDALPRIDKTIDFAWKPMTWYRLKLSVEQQGESARVRGKAWPRDAAEPAEWNLELTDPRPNREGSPALYGYATGTIAPLAEIFYDNVKVTPNK